MSYDTGSYPYNCYSSQNYARTLVFYIEIQNAMRTLAAQRQARYDRVRERREKSELRD